MSFQLETVIWVIPAVLLVLAVFQLIYLLILSSGSGRRRRSNQPTSPVMPPIEPGVMPSSNTGSYPSTLSDAPPAPSAPEIQQPVVTTNPMMSGSSIGKFIVLSGLQGVTEVNFPSNKFGIGRFHNPDANILVAFDEKSISRKHAIFICDEQLREYYLVDTNSSYGTHVMIDEEYKTLSPGENERVYNEDTIQFGNNVLIRLILPTETRDAIASR